MSDFHSVWLQAHMIFSGIWYNYLHLLTRIYHRQVASTNGNPVREVIFQALKFRWQHRNVKFKNKRMLYKY